MNRRDVDPVRLFSDFMRLTGVPTLEPECGGDPALAGKTLGIINGSSWTVLWSTWFARTILPGVKVVTVGNEAVQLSFMKAHREGRPVPPQSNIDAFRRYAIDLVELAGVDAIILTCSTMNRSAVSVREAVKPYDVPVVQIDEAMMARAVASGGPVLVVATHGPTVANTRALLEETAATAGREIEVHGATVEDAFDRLGEGDIEGHNAAVEGAIRGAVDRRSVRAVVLAQLSMSVFSFTHPNPEAEFGVPVFTSGQVGFEEARRVLIEHVPSGPRGS